MILNRVHQTCDGQPRIIDHVHHCSEADIERRCCQLPFAATPSFQGFQVASRLVDCANGTLRANIEALGYELCVAQGCL